MNNISGSFYAANVKDDVSINLFIISSQDIYCCGFVERLSQVETLNISQSSGNDKDLINNFKASDVDILLVHQGIVDLWTSIVPREQLFTQFKNDSPDIKIVLFDCDSDETNIRQMILAGAHGILPKSITIDETINAIEDINKGYYWIEHPIVDNLITSSIEVNKILEDQVKDNAEKFRDKLTNRESDVFELLMHGLTTKDIAIKLNLSEQSIKLHLGRLYKKFNVTNRTQLVIAAFSYISPVKNMLPIFQDSLNEKRGIESEQAKLVHD